MSILTDALPECIIICGKPYKIATDFRVWLKADKILRDRRLSDNERMLEIIQLCFEPEGFMLPPLFDELPEAVMNFYACGKAGTQNKKGTRKTPLFSYEEDAEYIYASFYQQYGIDLTVENMHWWKFCALFSGLLPDTQIMKIISYRSINTAEISDQKCRSFYSRMKEIYKLPDNRSNEERESALAEALSQLI